MTAPALVTEVTDLVVVARRAEAEGVLGLELARADGGPLPSWTPGAHVDLLLPTGLVRQYSLCGDPADPGRWRIAVLREPVSRGGSQWLHDHLGEGGAVGVRGPRNNFPLVPAAAYRFVAGGIGITPLLPMIREVAARGLPWTLHYGGRHRGAMAFVDELAAQCGSVVGGSVVGGSVVGGSVVVHPQDEKGLLDIPAAVGDGGEGAVVYCCGPGGLLDAVQAHCAGWPAGRLHVERFTPVERAGQGPDAAIEVECAASGVTVQVPAGVSVLAALEDAGLPVLSSCTEGICGTCETRVLAGEPEHRDSLLTEEEQAAGDTMMICVSRARSARLVLDL